MRERQLLLAGLQVLLPRYSHRGETGGPWGRLQGLAQPAWGGQVLCRTRAWGLSSSLVLRPQGDAAWGTRRSCPAPWSSPRIHNLV